jgi:nitrate reductase NapE component
MNQTASHSQTPTFGHIPATGILYQQPPSNEQIAQVNRRNKLKADFKDFILFIVFALCTWLLISVLLTAAFGGSN